MIPIILFVYARPDHLRRTLDCLRENGVPLIYAFSDGPRTPDKIPAVNQVRDMLRKIKWCEVVICERETNLGLGRSILSGVTEVLGKHEAAIVFEDDLVCVPGTYEYLCTAMQHYKNDPRVMTVTGWTHSHFTPSDITDKPYFDGRSESLTWGIWSRSWKGMETDAKTLMEKCRMQGIDEYGYGADLVEMANTELQRNIWAVRLLYLHILNRGLCLRPPWTMVEHIGFDEQGTNAKEVGLYAAPPLKECPPLPKQWPEVVENLECALLYRKIYGKRPTLSQKMYSFIHPVVSIPGRIKRKIFKGR